MYGTLELGVYGIFGSLDLRILSVPPENKKRGLCVFASRLVLQIFLESYGTLVAVSAPLVIPLHDLDILMNVPFTSCNKQPITSEASQVQATSGCGIPPPCPLQATTTELSLIHQVLRRAIASFSAG